jgi:hypothetical protein
MRRGVKNAAPRPDAREAVLFHWIQFVDRIAARLICPSGVLPIFLSSLFFGFSEKYLLPSDPNQI